MFCDALLIDKAPELLAMVKDSSVNAQVSMIIYDVRKQADPVAVGRFGRDDLIPFGTELSVISRLG